MSEMMEYRGYFGDAAFSAEDRVFYGKLQGIRALVDYSGNSVETLETNFHEAVDDYLVLCEEEGVEPERPATGAMTIRLSPAIRAKVASIASRNHTSINRTIEQAIAAYNG